MATPLGRRYTVTQKLVVGSIGAVFVCLLTYLPRLAVVVRDYGLGQLFAPAMSLQSFNHIPAWIPLIGILLWGLWGDLLPVLL